MCACVLGSAQGLARFAVDSYEAPCPDNASNVHMHLTNYSLNRKADGFKYCDAADGGDGSKRTATSVFRSEAAVHGAGAWHYINTLHQRPAEAPAAVPPPPHDRCPGASGIAYALKPQAATASGLPQQARPVAAVLAARCSRRRVVAAQNAMSADQSQQHVAE